MILALAAKTLHSSAARQTPLDRWNGCSLLCGLCAGCVLSNARCINIRYYAAILSSRLAASACRAFSLLRTLPLRTTCAAAPAVRAAIRAARRTASAYLFFPPLFSARVLLVAELLRGWRAANI